MFDMMHGTVNIFFISFFNLIVGLSNFSTLTEARKCEAHSPWPPAQRSENKPIEIEGIFHPGSLSVLVSQLVIEQEFKKYRDLGIVQGQNSVS